jgi:hypothetical protein
MRKLSFLIVASAVLALSFTASASAADRYAAPTADPSADANVCAPDHPCSIEVAMDTSKITTGSSVRLAPGTYSVSTALSLTVPDTGLRGQGPASATVINSTVATGSALTIDGASEGSKFTLNSQTSGDGLNVVDGNVDHVASTNSESHACTGVHATIVESLCRST